MPSYSPKAPVKVLYVKKNLGATKLKEFSKELSTAHEEMFFSTEEIQNNRIQKTIESAQNNFDTPVTDEMLYTSLNTLDLNVPRNQLILVNLFNNNPQLSNEFFGSSPSPSSSVKIEIDIDNISPDLLKDALGLEEYGRYITSRESNNFDWIDSQENKDKLTLAIQKINAAASDLIKISKNTFRDKFYTEKDFAYSFFARWNIPDNQETINPYMLHLLALKNPGAALGILINPILRKILIPVLSNDDYTLLLQQAAAENTHPKRQHYLSVTLDLLLKHSENVERMFSPEVLRSLALQNSGIALKILMNSALRNILLPVLTHDDYTLLLHHAASENENPHYQHYFPKTLDLLLTYSEINKRDNLIINFNNTLNAVDEKSKPMRDIFFTDQIRPDIGRIFEKHVDFFVALTNNKKKPFLSQLLFHSLNPLDLLKKAISYLTLMPKKAYLDIVIEQLGSIISTFANKISEGTYKNSSLKSMTNFFNSYIETLIEKYESEKERDKKLLLKNQIERLFSKTEISDKLNISEAGLIALYPSAKTTKSSQDYLDEISKNRDNLREYIFKTYTTKNSIPNELAFVIIHKPHLWAQFDPQQTSSTLSKILRWFGFDKHGLQDEKDRLSQLNADIFGRRLNNETIPPKLSDITGWEIVTYLEQPFVCTNNPIVAERLKPQNEIRSPLIPSHPSEGFVKYRDNPQTSFSSSGQEIMPYTSKLSSQKSYTWSSFDRNSPPTKTRQTGSNSNQSSPESSLESITQTSVSLTLRTENGTTFSLSDANNNPNLDSSKSFKSVNPYTNNNRQTFFSSSGQTISPCTSKLQPHKSKTLPSFGLNLQNLQPRQSKDDLSPPISPVAFKTEKGEKANLGIVIPTPKTTIFVPTSPNLSSIEHDTFIIDDTNRLTEQNNTAPKNGGF